MLVKISSDVRYWHLADIPWRAIIALASDNHGALTICLHAGGKLSSVNGGFGLLGGGCSVDSLNQKSSS